MLAKIMLSTSETLTQTGRECLFCLFHLLLWGGSEGQHGAILLWQLGRQVASVQGAPNGHCQVGLVQRELPPRALQMATGT